MISKLEIRQNHKQKLIEIVAETAGGKSSMAIGLACKAASYGKSVLIVSDDEAVRWIIGQVERIDAIQLGGNDYEDIVRGVRQHCRAFHPKVVILDCVQTPAVIERVIHGVDEEIQIYRIRPAHQNELG